MDYSRKSSIYSACYCTVWIVEYDKYFNKNSHRNVYASLFSKVHKNAWYERNVLVTNHIFFVCRSFIYPFLMRPGSKSPLLPTVMAFFFCLFNGFLQTHVLIYDKMVSNWFFAQYYLQWRAIQTALMAVYEVNQVYFKLH